MRFLAPAILPILLFAACKGDMGTIGQQGPTGPQGPQGPQGIQGMQGIQGPAGPLVSRDQLPCPQGMVNIGTSCIEPTRDSNGPTAYQIAVRHCASRSRRLCRFDELLRACSDFAGQVQNIGNAPEILADVVADDGGFTMRTFGATGCESMGTTNSNTEHRCCL